MFWQSAIQTSFVYIFWENEELILKLGIVYFKVKLILRPPPKKVPKGQKNTLPNFDDTQRDRKAERMPKEPKELKPVITPKYTKVITFTDPYIISKKSLSATFRSFGQKEVL